MPAVIIIVVCPGVMMPVMQCQHPWPIVKRFPSFLDTEWVEGASWDPLSLQDWETFPRLQRKMMICEVAEREMAIEDSEAWAWD